MPLPCTPQTWEKAAELLERQAAMANRLAYVLQSKPRSGLYRDEQDADFTAFARHVRSSLSLSPRTVLRAALYKGLQRLSSDDVMQKMCKLLGLAASPKQMHELAHAVSLLPPGQCYSKLQHAQHALEQHKMTDPQDICNQVQDKLGSAKTEAELETIFAKVRDKHQQRSRHLEERANRIEAELSCDSDFIKYKAVQSMWDRTGFKNLWERYLEVDLQLCRLRSQQGASFESQQDLVFAMIASRIIEARGVSKDQFSYACNVNWWDDGGKAVGEIDLVILQSGKVVAVCEMKSSCFLVSHAIRQHEQRVASYNSGGGIAIGTTPTTLFPICSDQPVDLFVATLLPDSSAAEHHLLGAEPMLATAVGDGIRDQGLSIANELTQAKCVPLVDLLLGLDERNTSEQAVQHLSRISKEDIKEKDTVRNLQNQPEDDLDFVRLAGFVQDRLGDTLSCSLSPADTFCKWRPNIVILE